MRPQEMRRRSNIKPGMAISPSRGTAPLSGVYLRHETRAVKPAYDSGHHGSLRATVSPSIYWPPFVWLWYGVLINEHSTISSAKVARIIVVGVCPPFQYSKCNRKNCFLSMQWNIMKFIERKKTLFSTLQCRRVSAIAIQNAIKKC